MQKNGYLDVKGQIELLRTKGIVVTNRDVEILNKVNYYTIMSYKNIFYVDGILHQYRKGISLKDFYTVYLLDNEIKNLLLKKFKILTNKFSVNLISKFCEHYGYLEDAYLSDDLYNNMFVKDYYISLLSDDTIKYYYDEHGFIPLWILINNMSFSDLIKYILSFKTNIKRQFELNFREEILLYSIDVYATIFSNVKTYDFNKNGMKLNDLIIWFESFNIDVNDIKNKYVEIVNNINCLNNDDIKRVSGIELGGVN